MTFSDSRIVDLVEQKFVPVWESVSPVQVAVFELGDGKSVKGTVGGEIALSFCLSDGRVFDVLPALQSPAVTREAILAAAELHRTLGEDDDAYRRHHLSALESLRLTHRLTPDIARAKVTDAHAELVARLGMASAATDAMTISAFSKTMMVTPAETVTVVEPGGLWLYKAMIHDELRRQPLRQPEELTETLFEGILGQPRNQPSRTYDLDEVAPMSLID